MFDISLAKMCFYPFIMLWQTYLPYGMPWVAYHLQLIILEEKCHWQIASYLFCTFRGFSRNKNTKAPTIKRAKNQHLSLSHFFFHLTSKLLCKHRRWLETLFKLYFLLARTPANSSWQIRQQLLSNHTNCH